MTAGQRKRVENLRIQYDELPLDVGVLGLDLRSDTSADASDKRAERLGFDFAAVLLDQLRLGRRAHRANLVSRDQDQLASTGRRIRFAGADRAARDDEKKDE